MVSEARKWLLQGGGGHEDGESGIRAMTVSGEGLVETLEAYDEYLAECAAARDKAARELRLAIAEARDGHGQVCPHYSPEECVCGLYKQLDSAIAAFDRAYSGGGE